MSYQEVYQPANYQSGELSDLPISTEKAHSGAQSLKLAAGTVSFPQRHLSLRAGKEYLLSLWVSQEIHKWLIMKM